MFGSDRLGGVSGQGAQWVLGRHRDHAAMVDEAGALERIGPREDQPCPERHRTDADQVAPQRPLVGGEQGLRQIAVPGADPGGNRQAPAPGQMFADPAQEGVGLRQPDPARLLRDEGRLPGRVAVGRVEGVEEVAQVVLPVAVVVRARPRR